MMNKVDRMKQVHQIEFKNAACFWVYVHDLPLMDINEYMGRIIRDDVGEVEEVDIENDEMAWDEYM